MKLFGALEDNPAPLLGFQLNAMSFSGGGGRPLPLVMQTACDVSGRQMYIGDARRKHPIHPHFEIRLGPERSAGMSAMCDNDPGLALEAKDCSADGLTTAARSQKR
jgi:hypothetical protein